MRNISAYLRFGILVVFIGILSCKTSVNGIDTGEAGISTGYPVNTRVVHPEWTKDAVIYEVNIRQHTKEGTFRAFSGHIPRLKEMGVDILWLMPVFPIGELNRKAAQTVLAEEIADTAERGKYLGSYYAIRDYMDVNPEFGTLEDFQDLVDKIHDAGMYVILDIAVNHTAWDHSWVTEKPEYYTRIAADSTPWNPQWMSEHPEYYDRIRELGMTYPIDQNGETDWWDVADLDFDNKELRDELKTAFAYWVSEFDIDGYRCDVAGRVPCDFWNDVRTELDKIKPVFMLAEDEADACLLQTAFDMNYSWELHHIMNRIARGEEDKDHLEGYFLKMDTLYDPDIYRMNFITNHDENSWNGTVRERLGESSGVFAMLSFTLPGMPLLYSGQEMGLDKRLKFFERDPMVWKESPWEEFYRTLIRLKTDNPAFWNGGFGGSMTLVEFPGADNVFAFKREKEDNRFLIITNLDDEQQEFILPEGLYFDWYTGEALNTDNAVFLGSWDYRILRLGE